MSKALVWAVLLGACAHGGSTEPTDAPVNAHHDDAPNNVNVDAPPDAKIDSMVIPDTFIPPDASLPPDASGSGLFCTLNSDCTTAGECCFIISSPPGVCLEGTIVLNACIPNIN